MDESIQFDIPSELAMHEFFGAEPLDRDSINGFWPWEVLDQHGAHLRFSVNVLERSVQTALSLNQKLVAVVSHENAVRLWLTNVTGTPELVVSFDGGSEHTELRVSVHRGISCAWSTLACH